jgi:hypothetical protein
MSLVDHTDYIMPALPIRTLPRAKSRSLTLPETAGRPLSRVVSIYRNGNCGDPEEKLNPQKHLLDQV